jgi:hypothetical protein
MAHEHGHACSFLFCAIQPLPCAQSTSKLHSCPDYTFCWILSGQFRQVARKLASGAGAAPCRKSAAAVLVFHGEFVSDARTDYTLTRRPHQYDRQPSDHPTAHWLRVANALTRTRRLTRQESCCAHIRLPAHFSVRGWTWSCQNFKLQTQQHTTLSSAAPKGKQARPSHTLNRYSKNRGTRQGGTTAVAALPLHTAKTAHAHKRYIKVTRIQLHPWQHSHIQIHPLNSCQATVPMQPPTNTLTPHTFGHTRPLCT